MAIDRLSSTSALIAAVRASATNRPAQVRRGSEAADTDKPSARTVAGRPPVAVLRQELVDLVRGADIEDPTTVHRLRPRVVRSILLWEFGATLREHPDWQPMLEAIVSTLATDAGQRDRFLELLIDLRRSAPD